MARRKAQSSPPSLSRREAYEQKVHPLLEKAVAECKKHGITLITTADLRGVTTTNMARCAVMTLDEKEHTQLNDLISEDY